MLLAQLWSTYSNNLLKKRIIFNEYSDIDNHYQLNKVKLIINLTLYDYREHLCEIKEEVF